VFSSCSYKGNGIEEKEFLTHLKDQHLEEMLEISKKENMPINIIEMIQFQTPECSLILRF
jgi:hypothetical protein